MQSGRYEELRQSELDFSALVAAHETYMGLVETSTSVSSTDAKQADDLSDRQVSTSPENGSGQSELNGERGESKPEKGSSKLIEDEERETGRVSLSVYKQYCTEAYGWWGITAVVLTSILWQVSQMLSDYWLAYETSEAHSFVASMFIGVYSAIAVVSCVFLAVRSILVAHMGLKTGQSFFNQILNSILHAPMSFFDTTPSGRVLSRVSLNRLMFILNQALCLDRWLFRSQASSDQSNVDILIPLFLSVAIVLYISLIGILIMTCQYAWPTILLIIPLIWLNIWYQVCRIFTLTMLVYASVKIFLYIVHCRGTILQRPVS